jgi:hypothetical protein
MLFFRGGNFGGVVMRSVQVQFPSGRELLNSYWGFLKHGGLVLREPRDLKEGDLLLLDVKIRSLKQSYRFEANVVRRSADGERAFVAFGAGQDEASVMLNAAWADTHDVPQRKHVRVPVSDEISYSASDGSEAAGHLVNWSRGGCAVKGTVPVPVGSKVHVLARGIDFEGKVRWTTPACEMGIEFVQPGPAIEALLRLS